MAGGPPRALRLCLPAASPGNPLSRSCPISLLEIAVAGFREKRLRALEVLKEPTKYILCFDEDEFMLGLLLGGVVLHGLPERTDYVLGLVGSEDGRAGDDDVGPHSGSGVNG